MLPLSLTTLVNASVLANLPYRLPENQVSEYRARFLSSGPDAAIELTGTTTRCYVDGVVCKAENAFTVFVENYEQSLGKAWRKLRRKATDTVVLAGRWHMPEVSDGVFDAFVIHVVDAQGCIRSLPYQLEIFDHDYHQNAMTWCASGQISDKSLITLKNWTNELTVSLLGQLTAFGVPHADGVAWLPDDPSLPIIFDHVDWLQGLDRHLLDETLELNPKGFQSEMTEQVSGSVKLGNLMKVTRYPIYVFQMEVEPGEEYDPLVGYYSEEKAERYSDIMLSEGSPVEGVRFASDWHSRGGFRYRIMV